MLYGLFHRSSRNKEMTSRVDAEDENAFAQSRQRETPADKIQMLFSFGMGEMLKRVAGLIPAR